MKHIHKYETITHLGISSEARALGIKEAEIRKCSTCKKETTYILTRKNEWIPLFIDEETDGQNILLA